MSATLVIERNLVTNPVFLIAGCRRWSPVRNGALRAAERCHLFEMSQFDWQAINRLGDKCRWPDDDARVGGNCEHYNKGAV